MSKVRAVFQKAKNWTVTHLQELGPLHQPHSTGKAFPCHNNYWHTKVFRIAFRTYQVLLPLRLAPGEIYQSAPETIVNKNYFSLVNSKVFVTRVIKKQLLPDLNFVIIRNEFNVSLRILKGSSGEDTINARNSSFQLSQWRNTLTQQWKHVN